MEGYINPMKHIDEQVEHMVKTDRVEFSLSPTLKFRLVAKDDVDEYWIDRLSGNGVCLSEEELEQLYDAIESLYRMNK